jgi:hypothetical protein
MTRRSAVRGAEGTLVRPRDAEIVTEFGSERHAFRVEPLLPDEKRVLRTRTKRPTHAAIRENVSLDSAGIEEDGEPCAIAVPELCLERKDRVVYFTAVRIEDRHLLETPL